MALKVYLASSWKNKWGVNTLAEVLRAQGFEVDDFTDTSNGRFVFSWKEITEDDKLLNARSFLKDERVQKAFAEDKKWLDWADVIVMLLPCGKSAHLELGYARGCGKKTVVFAPDGFPQGEWEVMYGFADALIEDIGELYSFLSEVRDELR